MKEWDQCLLMLGDAKVDEHGNVYDTEDCNVVYLDMLFVIGKSEFSFQHLKFCSFSFTNLCGIVRLYYHGCILLVDCDKNVKYAYLEYA